MLRILSACALLLVASQAEVPETSELGLYDCPCSCKVGNPTAENPDGFTTPEDAGVELGSQGQAIKSAPAGKCTDMTPAEFKKHWHQMSQTVTESMFAFKHEKTCEHAMMQGQCVDENIKNACCKSCTAHDGKGVCIDKSADALGRILGKPGVSCGLLVQAGMNTGNKKDGCNDPKVKANCCARCKKYEVYGTCTDVSEQTLRKKVGNVEGEGGCPHAAAHGKCEKSSLYHKLCCKTCTLHRDIETKSYKVTAKLAAKKACPKCPACKPPAGIYDKWAKWLPKAVGDAKCHDTPDAEFKVAYHKLVQTVTESMFAFKHEKSCPHAMMHNECGNEDVKDLCCKSCTADDGAVCVDKSAEEISRILGKPKVSCALVVQAGAKTSSKKDGCDDPKIKANCCSRCREHEMHATCQDVSEQTLRATVGNVEGEGGCLHAAAHGKCEKSSLYHRMCCESCRLHRDMHQ